ncbi:hypothetical protein [Halodesulfovibrio sp.]|jgi:hypothetical protein|uniref:hypothetical protein n=1 Tax=Halodesulfovibrio sp. TaxID=1912772 RepID=UPI0025C0F62B|nr:hypothetical protein [Halodesulfovibrio sp.]
MNVHAEETIKLISVGLRLGMKAYESAVRLTAAGYVVPGFDDFQRQTANISDDVVRRERKKSVHQVVGHA